MDRNSPSLRKQTATTLTLALAILAIVVNVAVFQYIKHVDLGEFDKALVEELESIAAMTTVEGLEPLEIELELHGFHLPEFQPSATAKYYQLWDSRKIAFLRSPSLGNQDLPNVADDSGNVVIQDIELPDGRAGRMASYSGIVRPQVDEKPDEGEVALLREYRPEPIYQTYFSLAISREHLDSTLRLELILALLTSLILIVGAVGIVRFLINRCFGKLESLADQIENVGYHSLSTRLSEEGMAQELVPIATKFNNLLGRLELGVEREKRFANNISHELRTPISELRLLTEVGQRECARGELEDVASYFDDATEMTIRMDRLIETVSAFNRMASGREKPVIESFHLAPTVKKASEAHSDKARLREVTIDLAVPENAVVDSDRSLVFAILSNLIGNAVSHSPIGSAVKIQASQKEDGILIEIQNPNSQLAMDDLDRIAEPFWQKDSARTENEHFGMGVALVESYCQLLGISFEFSLPKPDSFLVTLKIPTARL